MRYLATKACQDHDGQIYFQGQIVDLEPGSHTKYLSLLDEVGSTAERASAEVIQKPKPAKAVRKGRARKIEE